MMMLKSTTRRAAIRTRAMTPAHTVHLPSPSVPAIDSRAEVAHGPSDPTTIPAAARKQTTLAQPNTEPSGLGLVVSFGNGAS